MIPVSKISEFRPEHLGELVSYRRGYCVGFIGSRHSTIACSRLLQWAVCNGITFPDYSERLSASDVGWNRIEYAMLSLNKDVIYLTDLEDTFGDDEIFLVNPYLIWYLGTQIFNPEVPYPNESQPLESVLEDLDYLRELYIQGKREGWYEAIYRYNNSKDRITKTSDNFVSVKSPKVLYSGEVSPMIVSITKKPWYPYGVERDEHIISGPDGFYVVVCYGGYVQFIAEMGAYLEESKCEEISTSSNPLTDDQIILCAKIMGSQVIEM